MNFIIYAIDLNNDHMYYEYHQVSLNSCYEEAFLCINTLTIPSSYLICEESRASGLGYDIVRDQRVECEWCSDRLIVKIDISQKFHVLSGREQGEI